jgi:ribonuclease R
MTLDGWMRDNETPMRPDDDHRQALLDYLSGSDYRPLTQSQLLHQMQVPPEQRRTVRRLLRELLSEGRIGRLPGGRLAARTPERVQGLLHRHRDGYGFVVTEEEGPDVFIAPPHLGDNLSGDRVAVRVTRQSRGNRLEGVIVRTLERRSRRALGVFMGAAPGGNVQPFEAGMAASVRIPESFRGGAGDGQVVRFEILSGGGKGQPPEGKVLQVLGDLDEPGMDTHIVARKYGLPLSFPQPALDAAGELPSVVGPKKGEGRTLFDDPSPVTIDGETAEDFDDAIAVKPLPRGGTRLFVHIADVAQFVPAGSGLDEEARRRGTSVYFPGRVLPMFPEKLSNDLCSLRPGVKRLVQTAILDFDQEGAVTQVRFADGIIRSAARLTYTQVERVIDGEKRVPGVPQRVVPMLLLADQLRRLLEQRRHERGSIDFDLPEPQILLDVEGVMTGITIEPRNRAHRLIEEFMLAANEAVAGYLDSKAGVCVYRVHEPPESTKLETLAHFVERFGVPFARETSSVTSQDYQQLLDRVEGRPEARLVRSVALRSMKQARYSVENDGHFSLASPLYCHFTSPIRRYPDLLVHRLLRDARRGRKPTTEEIDRLAEQAANCSELERNAEAAERELLNWKKVAFIADKVGQDFEAVVTGVAAFGMFLQLESNLVEGLLRVDRLGDERFEFDDRRVELQGQQTGRTYRLGDRLRVRVERVDRVLQRVDFAPMTTRQESAAGPKSRPGRRGGRRRGAVVQ